MREGRNLVWSAEPSREILVLPSHEDLLAGKPKELKIDHCNFTDSQVRALSFVLEKNLAIEHLSLHGCCLGNRQIALLAPSLERQRTVRRLDLSYNYIEPSVFSSLGIKELAKAIQSNRTITHLKLSENALGTTGAKLLGRALKVNTKIMSLNLRSNFLGSKGMKALAREIQTPLILQRLNLCNNDIGDSGFTALGTLLSKGGALRYLDLSHNRLMEQGLKSVVSGMEMGGMNLEGLKLSLNALGEEGIQVFVGYLQKQKGLKRLSFCYPSHELSTQNWITIIEALTEYGKLEKLHLHGLKLPEGLSESIQNLLLANEKLDSIENHLF